MTAEEVLAQQFQEFVAQAALANGGVRAPAGTPASSQIKMTIGGQELTFDNIAAAEQAMNNTVTTAARELAERDRALAEFRNQHAPAAPATPDNTARNAQFFADLERDPIAAIQGLIPNALNETIFGGKVPNAAEVLRRTALNAENTSQLVEVQRFQDANQWLDLTKHGSTIENIRQKLGLDVSAQSFDAALATGLKNGLIEGPRQETTKAPPSTGRFAPQQNYNAEQPAFDTVTENMLETIPMDQLATFIRSQGGFGE